MNRTKAMLLVSTSVLLASATALGDVMYTLNINGGSCYNTTGDLYRRGYVKNITTSTDPVYCALTSDYGGTYDLRWAESVEVYGKENTDNAQSKLCMKDPDSTSFECDAAGAWPSGNGSTLLTVGTGTVWDLDPDWFPYVYTDLTANSYLYGVVVNNYSHD